MNSNRIKVEDMDWKRDKVKDKDMVKVGYRYTNRVKEMDRDMKKDIEMVQEKDRKMGTMTRDGDRDGYCGIVAGIGKII